MRKLRSIALNVLISTFVAETTIQVVVVSHLKSAGGKLGNVFSLFVQASREDQTYSKVICLLASTRYRVERSPVNPSVLAG